MCSVQCTFSTNFVSFLFPYLSVSITENENRKNYLLFVFSCVEEGEYMLRWSEHNSQLINVFHQLCQVSKHPAVFQF